MVQAVVFDLDGTLANTLEDLADAANYAISFFNAPPHKINEYKYFIGDGIHKLIERALPQERKSEADVLAAKQIFLEYYSHHYADKTCAYDGMPELILKLKELGIKVAVVTNKAQQPANEVTQKLFGDSIKVVVGQREGLPTKPDPAPVFLALDLLGVNAKNTLFVGDSGMDMAAAVGSGTIPVGVTWGFRESNELIENGAKHIVNNPSELLKLALSL
ncbi:MAG: HAD family hydrolase [Clostridia bacterium]|nr:HAD family hydrolase [Clostridia bacterium]